MLSIWKNDVLTRMVRFDPLEVITLFLSVLLVRFATEDGRTHYMRYFPY